MNKVNPLAGLIGNYGDSDDSDEEPPLPPNAEVVHRIGDHGIQPEMPLQPPGVQPAPIPHCPWSACYDESSGFTYYWNQQTNAVTWETPPEYLLALRLAQQQLHTPGPSEVSAEEWQLYQQALAEKQGAQNKVPPKPASTKPGKANHKSPVDGAKNNTNKKRRFSEPEEEKIELITSYHNSDSESNDEAESPVKQPTQPPPAKVSKSANKKPKPKPAVVTYGPALPPNQNYSMPIGPEMPPDILNGKAKSPETSKSKIDNAEIRDEGKKSAVLVENEDSQDESALLMKLKDKAQLLESLGGEIPSEIHKMIYENNYTNTSQKSKESIDAIDNIDDLLNEIEKKELPKIKSKKTELLNEENARSKDIEGAKKSPKSREVTPPIEPKPLFPSIKNIVEEDIRSPKKPNDEEHTENTDKSEVINANDKKGANLYLMSTNEPIENTHRKKFRISNSVLPERKKTESPVYTTKYAQSVDGFTTERTGLGFNKDELEEESPKNTISYGNGLTFTKGETLNEEKRDEDLDDLTDLVEAKLKYLNQLQPCTVTPVQEMLIQMQTLVGAFRAGALRGAWWRRWAQGAARALAAHEAAAAPPGWTAAFLRSEGRYQYRRDSDGLVQWEYPAVANTDMDISTTPPHPGIEGKDEPPPLPQSPEAPTPAPAPPAPPAAPAPPAPPAPVRAHTPPPPAWADPPPPGCDDPPPLPIETKREIGDELMSFYNDIAELEKQTSAPHTACNSPEAPSPPRIEPKEKERERERDSREKDRTHRDHREKDRDHREKERVRKEKEREREKEAKISKKKNKVKISTSMGLKHKTVSSLVAKWQQVAEEIHSD